MLAPTPIKAESTKLRTELPNWWTESVRSIVESVCETKDYGRAGILGDVAQDGGGDVSCYEDSLRSPDQEDVQKGFELIIATAILESYAYNEHTKIHGLTIPPGVSDIEAMKALNTYFRVEFPSRNRDAIYAKDFDWFANQPTVSGRDISKERRININPLVEGTTSKDRVNQEIVLGKVGMTFAAPEEVALVLAAYACKNDGKDLLNDNWTRTAASGAALSTDPGRGVRVRGDYGDSDDSDVGASGVALPAN